jgi:hypothetical protein
MARIRSAGPALVLGAVLLVANVPRLLAGALLGNPGQTYTGEVWDAFDLPQYVEAIHEGAAGRWLYEGRLWGGSGNFGYFFQQPYLLAGHLAGALGASSLQTLEALRWIAQLVAVAGALLLIRRAVAPELRAWALFFGGIAGGLGFLFLGAPVTPLGPVVPMDVATPSFNLVAAFLGAPHLALMAGCIALFAWGFLAVAAGDRRGLAGLLALIVALNVHPFELVAIVASACATALLLARSRLVLAYVALAVLLCLAELVYLAVTARSDPVFEAMSQTSLTTEVGNLPSFLASRAVLLPLAAAAALSLRRRRDATVLFLAGWAFLSVSLNVAAIDPAGPLHRSLEGSSLAWGALASLALPSRQTWRALALGTCLISPLVQAGGVFYAAGGNPDSWVSTNLLTVARQASASDLRGCVTGALRDVRWLAAESELCQVPDNEAALADLESALPADRPVVLGRHGARFAILRSDQDSSGLYPVLSAGDLVLVAGTADSG